MIQVTKCIEIIYYLYFNNLNNMKYKKIITIAICNNSALCGSTESIKTFAEDCKKYELEPKAIQKDIFKEKHNQSWKSKSGKIIRR